METKTEKYFYLEQSIDGGKSFESIGFKIYDESEALRKLALISCQETEKNKFRLIECHTVTVTNKIVRS